MIYHGSMSGAFAHGPCTGRRRRRALVAALCLALLWCPLAAGAAETAEQTVSLPLTLDYPFLRALLIEQLYTAPNQRILAADQHQGCTRIELWDPKVSSQGGLLVVDTRLRFKLGLVVLGTCFNPLEWEGRIRLLQRVMVDPKTWLLTVHTVESHLLTSQGEPATVADTAWQLVRRRVHASLDRFSVNLSLPRDDLMHYLPPLLMPALRPRLERWLATLRLGRAQVGAKAVRVPMFMEVPRHPAAPEEKPPPAVTPQAMDSFLAYWKAWDAYLVGQIRTLAGEKLDPRDQDELLATLLDMRYGFMEALQSHNPDRDLVRRQFLEAWRRLAPIFRKYLVRNPKVSLFRYLAFFTASDALAALDRLGPSLGLEISTEGLRRLAWLVHKGKALTPLNYDYRLDPQLRGILGLGKAPREEGPEISGEELKLPAGESEPKKTPAHAPPPEPPPASPAPAPGPGSWLRWLLPVAWAAEPPADPRLAKVLPWLPSRSDYPGYLRRVRGLLDHSAKELLGKSDPPGGREAAFFQMVQAVAWQESCYRQFVRKKKGKVTFLRSYNRSSVGLMQINEWVWRGIYKRDRLRWDIAYNARAGCEILDTFRRRYVLKRLPAEDRKDLDLVARATYAVYNGGPRQLGRFLARLKRGRLYLSDRLFEQKLRWVMNGEHHRALDCLRHGRDLP